MNRHDRRRAEAQRRSHEARLRKDAGELEAKQMSNIERTWATGLIEVVANEFECFEWVGTRQDAVAIQKRYLGTMNTLSINARSYARRAAGYLMVYGMPDMLTNRIDRRPSTFGQLWTKDEIQIYKAAILWLALREHIPNTGQRLEDVFVGKALLVKFTGDKERILADSQGELRGKSLEGRKDVGQVELGSILPDDQFQMMVAVLDESYRLDPRAAVSMSTGDLFALAGKSLARDDPVASKPIYVPRIPRDAAEADAMLRMTVVIADATNPSSGVRTHAGYTNEELSGGRPHVLVGRR
jgi:hypothetical protein